MTEIALTIGGHHYRVACEPGQESTLLSLAKDVDARISALRSSSGAMSEVRQLLFAALTYADELSDLRAKLEQWEALNPALAGLASVNTAITNLANRLENIADTLENSPKAS